MSRENYTEAYAHIDDDTTWFIQGRINCNRAVNGDLVAVELLPEEDWTCPQKVIKVEHDHIVSLNSLGEVIIIFGFCSSQMRTLTCRSYGLLFFVSH